MQKKAQKEALALPNQYNTVQVQSSSDILHLKSAKESSKSIAMKSQRSGNVSQPLSRDGYVKIDGNDDVDEEVLNTNNISVNPDTGVNNTLLPLIDQTQVADQSGEQRLQSSPNVPIAASSKEWIEKMEEEVNSLTSRPIEMTKQPGGDTDLVVNGSKKNSHSLQNSSRISRKESE